MRARITLRQTMMDTQTIATTAASVWCRSCAVELRLLTGCCLNPEMAHGPSVVRQARIELEIQETSYEIQIHQLAVDHDEVYQVARSNMVIGNSGIRCLYRCADMMNVRCGGCTCSSVIVRNICGQRTYFLIVSLMQAIVRMRALGAPFRQWLFHTHLQRLELNKRPQKFRSPLRFRSPRRARERQRLPKSTAQQSRKQAGTTRPHDGVGCPSQADGRATSQLNVLGVHEIA